MEKERQGEKFAGENCGYFSSCEVKAKGGGPQTGLLGGWMALGA